MELFEGYVLQSELAEKANVSDSLFSQMNLVTRKMGGLVCILKSSLPKKYKESAKLCVGLDKYCSYDYLSKALGVSNGYLSVLDYQKVEAKKAPFESVKVGHTRLFKLNEEFISFIKEKLTPFKIRNKDDEEYAIEIIEMQGLKIGFY